MRRKRQTRFMLGWLVGGVAALVLIAPAAAQSKNVGPYQPKLTVDAETHPNILWVYLEDTNAWMSCYGDDVIETPNIDALAERGVRFDRAYMPAGVCSPTRSAVITGMYQTSIGAHEHYSSARIWRGQEMYEWEPNYLGVRTIPEMFKDAGYYTFNEGKFHYNFVYNPDELYDRNGRNGFKGAKDGSEWTSRAEGQPFFGQIQLRGGKKGNAPQKVDPADVPVPPYYPDHPVYRKEIAHHYDTILKMDEILGNIIDALKRDGLYENTVVFFFSDHGMKLPRHKQFLYEGGIRVPMIAAGPGVPEGKVRKGLVSGIDLGPTSLALAGIGAPDHTHGKDMFAEGYNRDYIIAARDRCDFTVDRIRTVVTDRYKYIRNFMTDRPYLQPQYRDGRDYMTVLKQLYKDGELNEVQSRFVSDHRPAEELYDLKNDPHETNNLVHSWKREHAVALAELRSIMHRWIIETDDKGRFPETNASLKASLQRWGDKAVAPEFNRVR